MAILRNTVDDTKSNRSAVLPFELRVDNLSEPAISRRPLAFTEVYLGQVTVTDFRRNPRGELGTRTATLHAKGIAKLRENWIYRR